MGGAPSVSAGEEQHCPDLAGEWLPTRHDEWKNSNIGSHKLRARMPHTKMTYRANGKGAGWVGDVYVSVAASRVAPGEYSSTARITVLLWSAKDGRMSVQGDSLEVRYPSNGIIEFWRRAQRTQAQVAQPQQDQAAAEARRAAAAEREAEAAAEAERRRAEAEREQQRVAEQRRREAAAAAAAAAEHDRRRREVEQWRREADEAGQRAEAQRARAEVEVEVEAQRAATAREADTARQVAMHDAPREAESAAAVERRAEAQCEQQRVAEQRRREAYGLSPLPEDAVAVEPAGPPGRAPAGGGADTTAAGAGVAAAAAVGPGGGAGGGAAAAGWAIPVGEVEVVAGPAGVVGRGALGEVRRGAYRGVQVALKGLHLLRTDAATMAAMGGALTPGERASVMASFLKECDMMRRCVHPNIVPFVGVVYDREPLYLALQYLPAGTLHDMIYGERYSAMRTESGALPLPTQMVANTGLFTALAFLATIPVIHRDVKPANILVRVATDHTVILLFNPMGHQISNTAHRGTQN
jgi:hypothetical protein